MGVANDLSRSLKRSGVLGHGDHIRGQVAVALESIIIILDNASGDDRNIMIPVVEAVTIWCR